MAQRSRKRGRRQRPTAGAAQRPAAGAPAGEGTAPASGAATAPAKGTATAPPPRRRLSAEERNAAVRATLTPLATGERPGAIKVSAAIAALVGAGNLIAWIAGAKVGGKHPAAGGIIIFSGLMLFCAWGLWRLSYWAVLGFMALLAIIVTLFTLLLLEASNVLGFLIPPIVIGGGGYLFFKLVRTLSRIQMPKYPGR